MGPQSSSVGIREGSQQWTSGFCHLLLLFLGFAFKLVGLILWYLKYKGGGRGIGEEKANRPWFYRPYRCIRHQTDPRCSSAVNSVTRGINPIHCFMWPLQHHQLIKANGSQSSTGSG